MSDSGMTEAQVNNQMLGVSIAIMGCLISLGMPWMSFVAQGGVGVDSMVNGMTLTITGTNGHVSFGPVKMPTWVVAVFPIPALISAILQAKGIIALSASAVLAATLIMLPFSLLALIIAVSKGSPELGVFVINVAIVVGAVFAFRMMRCAARIRSAL